MNYGWSEGLTMWMEDGDMDGEGGGGVGDMDGVKTMNGRWGIWHIFLNGGRGRHLELGDFITLTN